MSGNDSVNVVLGNPTIFFADEFDPTVGQKFLDVMKSHGFLDIDTARIYAAGEKNFGIVKAASQGFNIDTKIRSFTPGAHKTENVFASQKESFELLGVDKVNILYLHSPDRDTPFEETVKAMNDLYKQGKYEKFGLSNYTAAEVAQIVEICNKNGYVRPTVYQGNYSLLVRKGEAELFPLLKKEKISFYAWAPLAGGMLTGRFKTKADINQGSHFSHPTMGPVYTGIFARDSFFSALSELNEVSKSHNLTSTETALRWLAYHSQLSKKDGDGIILGGSAPSQFDNNIKEIKKGPLPLAVVNAVERVWSVVKDDSPPYHY